MLQTTVDHHKFAKEHQHCAKFFSKETLCQISSILLETHSTNPNPNLNLSKTRPYTKSRCITHKVNLFSAFQQFMKLISPEREKLAPFKPGRTEIRLWGYLQLSQSGYIFFYVNMYFHNITVSFGFP